MNYSKWVTDPELSEEERMKNRIKYLIRYAALQHNDSGSLPALAVAIGYSEESLYQAMRRGSVTPGMACALEAVLGQGIITKEQLCPETFPA
jgi:hypothetical protein